MALGRRYRKNKIEAGLKAWARQARRLKPGIKVPRSEIAPLDGETIVIDSKKFDEAKTVLHREGIRFWPMGALNEVCCRPDHSADWLEG